MIDLDSLSTEELASLVQQLDDYRRYNKLLYVKPYDYQTRFMNASAFYHQRYMRSGNRTGKTFGGALEFAQHVTGLYQPYFEGERIKDSGHTFWCIGIDLDSVSKVLQKELFGTADARMESEMGTGAIPRSCIELDKGMVKDGAKIRSCFIKHDDGGYNTIYFYGANNEANLMGQAVKFIWIDEEPHYRSDELYAQCLTRTLTTNGHMMFTATPEAGNTPLNERFSNDESGELYLQSVGWDECPHITEEIKNRMLAGYPEWQHAMRMNGIPVAGSGAVFPFKDSDITYDYNELDIYNRPSLRVVAGIDFGQTVDPSIVVFAAVDLETNEYFLLHEIYLGDDMKSRSPEGIAQAIKESPFPNAVVVVPHDGGLNSIDPESKGKMLISYGINVHPVSHRNPSSMSNDMMGKKVHNSIIGGLDMMNKMFRDGNLKVSTLMTRWIKEKAGYFYVPKTSGGVGFNGQDHVIDASRVAVMALLRHIYSTVPEAVDSRGPQWSPIEDIKFENRPIEHEDNTWFDRPDF